ncbi:MAG: ribosome maturation factor RimM [Propionicimonas sp.]|uniref:ribosome maturation factor RimM n=1 Tax=Propionicimonas sp. TaxID=1955623 RepID=UPI003D0EAA09
MDDRVIVGTIGRPHGLRGQVTLRPRTDSVEERFATGARVEAGGRTLTVTSHSFQQGRLVVGFAGVADRTAAEALRGLDVWAQGAVEAVADDEFHDTALIGLAAVDPAGTRLGEVIGVEHNPAHDLLVVRTPSGDRLVPFVAALVPEVDPAAGRLVIAPIPGLLDEAPDAD